MKISNNYSKLRLLANENITFTGDNGFSFEFKPITVRDALMNEDAMWLINTLDTDLEELQKGIQGYKIEKYLDFLTLICTLSKKQEEVKDMADTIIRGLNTLVDGISFTGKLFKINEQVLDSDMFDEIILVLFQSLDRDKIVINDDDTEMMKKQKRMKMKAARIKKNSKNNKDKNGTQYEDLFVSIMYEFPQYKLEDIFNLNLYTFYYLTGYIGKIANYEVNKIAFGTGNFKKGKKFKYFVEK